MYGSYGYTFLCLCIYPNFLLDTGNFRQYIVATLGTDFPLHSLLLLLACYLIEDELDYFGKVYSVFPPRLTV